MRFGILLISSLLLFPSISFAAITFTNGYWSTSFIGCDDWTQQLGGADPNCDGIEMADDSALFTGRASQINADGNHAAGAGGKGWRTYYDGGTHNEMTSPMDIVFPSNQTDLWIRFYYRIPDDQYMDDPPAHKILYLYNTFCSVNVNWPYYSSSLGIEVRGGADLDYVYDGSNRTAYGDPTEGNWYSVYGNLPSGGADGTWHYFEFQFSVGTTSSNGIFRMWIDGRNVVNDTALNFGGGNGGTWTNVYLPSNHDSFMSNSDLPNDIDDIAIANASYTGFVQNTTGFATGLNMIGPLSGGEGGGPNMVIGSGSMRIGSGSTRITVE